MTTLEDAERSLPRWASDTILIIGAVSVTYLVFAIVGWVAGLPVNAIVGDLRSITFFAAVFALTALALNLHWGYTGLFNIGVAGFMAVGFYTMAIVTASPEGSPAGLGLPISVGIVVGMLAAGAVGFLVALPALRVRADYFAIVTLGFSEIIRLLLLSSSLRSIEIGDRVYGTGGGSGIRSPPTTGVVPWALELPVLGAIGDVLFAIGGAVGVRDSVVEGILYTIVLIVFVVVLYVFLSRLARSPYGRILKAIREDELAAKSLGKDTDRVKITVFVVGCALMGLGGILWQGSRTHVSPNSFMPIITFYIFVALIVGGAGSNSGSIIGGFAFAAFLYEGPRFIRTIVRANLDVRSPPTIYDAVVAIGSGDLLPLLGYVVGGLDELRFVAIGVALIALMLWKPDGLFGHRKEIAAATDLSRRPRSVRGTPASDGNGADDEPGGGRRE